MATITHVNPESLHHNPAFTQVVRVSSDAELVFVGGQNGVDETGAVVAPDVASQARQALENLDTCLASSGARLEDVVKWTIFLRQDADLQEGFGVFGEVWGERGAPPAVTVAFVTGFAVPDAVIEIEAMAAV